MSFWGIVKRFSDWEKYQSMNVIEIMKELTGKHEKDIDLTSDLLVHIYQSASIDEQKLINKMCVCLTGVQFDTVLTRAGIEKPLNKVS